MTDPRPRLDRRGQLALHAERQRLWAQAQPEAGAWYAGSSLISGALLLGGAGWLLDRWLGWTWLLPVGVVLGMGAGMTSLWFRYGVARPPGGDHRGTSTDAGPRDRSGRSPGHRPTDRSPMEDAP